MPDIGFLLHPRSLLSGLTMPAEIFRAADELYRVHRRVRPRLRLRVATTDDRQVEGPSGLSVSPDCPLDRLAGVDLLYLPPFWRRPAVEEPEVLAAFRRLAAQGSLFCAVSTGAYLLAAAGLLDGGVATTHWSFLDDFAERFPQVELKRQHLITRSGNLYCTGSLNATADLTTHFVERFYDADTARGVEAQFSPEIRRPAALQGYFDGEIGAQPDELMAEAQQWLRQEAAAPVDLDQLADHLGISRRSLNRRFRRATGRTPVRYLQEARIAEASSLLRNSNLPIFEIATRVGYDDAAHFATLYRRLTDQTPSGYRAAVRAKLFTPD
ncbi:MAG: GlxA family transcriptional regulator [Thermoanaerobaculia bacterium]